MGWLNKKKTLLEVQKNGQRLSDAPNALKSDKEIVLAAVSNDGSAIQLASINLRRVRDVILEAARTYEEALLCAVSEDQNDYPFVASVVAKNAGCYKWVADTMKEKYPELMKSAHRAYIRVRFGGWFQFVPEHLTSDREFMNLAIRCGVGLEHAIEEFKNDREFLLTTLNFGSQYPHSNHPGKHIKLVPEKWRNDEEVVLAALGHCADIWSVEGTVRSKSFIEKAILKNPECIMTAPAQLLADKEFLLGLYKLSNDHFGAIKARSIHEYRNGNENIEADLRNFVWTAAHDNVKGDSSFEESIWKIYPYSIDADEG